MNRRIVLGAGVVAAAATAGWIALPSGKHPLTVAAATDALARLRGTKINHAGGWNPAQVFAHLAQSIEYSMTGFPQPKSPLFQSTVGAAAFAVFHSKGAMKHSLTEPIPGAPAIAATDDQTAALDRALKALADFDKFNGALQPHFAYGALDKKAYAAAHAMHVYNHLTEFSVA
ncbi:MAG TPA: DUF1569 domain-containing protein [Casimicrobium huifangae]|jgi:hypothetical protein|uniref:DUF1569 domain-containing protein n=1 Tax=Casimicrobium huifangae TaxID=2591109 RepID=UPI0012EB2F2D|nr:DUF1569 domain-containing protein [Casimicrobium huifangae]HOB02864.1 DUF1569 domain-containing protein [Casimicrobium huifangae]HQA35140.1 DUF1569 domain-containing protein [Casimicrobium huifangae]HQD64869.1 DUF1569 domain-containing protein [Casimicrobium huifangae]